MEDNKKIILDLCGGTGSWSEPYRKAGYDVRLITMPEMDVRLYQPPEKVYGILSAPPCTHFAVSGAKYWKSKGIEPLLDGLSVVDACLRIIMITKPVFWCLENPVGRLKNYIGKPVMYFQPCDYGDAYTKKTALWGTFNIPEKNPVEPVFMTTSKGDRFSPMFWKTGGKSDRTKEIRSITPQGFANAFFNANR